MLVITKRNTIDLQKFILYPKKREQFTHLKTDDLLQSCVFTLIYQEIETKS